MFKIKEMDVFTRYNRTMLILLVVMQLLLPPAVADDGTVTDENIDSSIEKGLYYLYENQLPSGEFGLYVSYSPDMSNRMRAPSVVGDTAFILHAVNLAESKDTEEIAQEIRTKAIGFLLYNMEPPGVWRSWAKNQTIIPAPPDVDDTSIVFSVLFESGTTTSDETLDYMLNYTTSDGIFKTYMNSEEWLDSSHPLYELLKRDNIDASVNADALYAYSLRNRTLNDIIHYLNGISVNKSFINGTLHYPYPYAFTYFVTKAYADGNIRELEPSIASIKDYLLETQQSDGGWGNDLHTSLAVVSLLNIGYEGKPVKKAIEYVLKNQNKDGSWNIYSSYWSSDLAYPPQYYGSQELTTSVNLEALIKYKKTLKYDLEECKEKHKQEG